MIRGPGDVVALRERARASGAPPASQARPGDNGHQKGEPDNGGEQEELATCPAHLHFKNLGLLRSMADDAAAAQSSLFQTGTGKSVQVSGDAMKRALALFAGDTEECPRPPKRPSSDRNAAGLFRTATGKPVDMTAAKAKALLQHQEQASKKQSGPGFRHPRRIGLTPPQRTSREPDEKSASSQPVDWKRLRLDLVPRTKTMVMPVRSSLRDYFLQHGQPRPVVWSNPGDVDPQVRSMTSDSAKQYTFSAGRETLGVDACRRKLLEAGAKADLATVDWVQNHYRWIVWKLAALERRFPQAAKSFLSFHNVLHELKYRYAREVLFGHRSVLKRISERDSSASVTMVLCVAAIRRKTPPGKVEVTDGWYSLNAILDPHLTEHLREGKLFIGQKLRISAATLVGASEGLPPLEAADVASLMLHINGTYRAHWAEKLGMCKTRLWPLALRCIKEDGGLVPLTCVTVGRLYPLMYMERLADGRYVSRGFRAEQLVQDSFEQRRAAVAEATSLRMQREGSCLEEDTEGGELYKLLELVADPEIMLADMTLEQHALLSAYQVRRMAAVDASVRQALQDASLLSRDVTPFLKVRVMGLQCSSNEEECSKEGVITIWAPDDFLLRELVEGGTYTISFLKARSFRSSDPLQLSTTNSSGWKALSPPMCESYRSLFSPRVATRLSSLGTISAQSEFDTAALVVHVADVRVCGQNSRQWVFLADGSRLPQEERPALLAVEFSGPVEALLRFELSLAGCVVGFCNLVKRQPDERNRMWTAGASDVCAYSTKMGPKSFSHLGKSAALTTRWAKSSPEMVARLQAEVKQMMSCD